MNASAGCRALELSDPQTGKTFPMLVMYPSHSPERSEQLGPFAVSVAMDGPVDGGPFPLVIVSHGSGGSHVVYHTLAAHLARNGFVVAIPEHPGNSRSNNELQGRAENLVNRPRHVRLAIDWAFSSELFRDVLIPDAVAIVGHSMGGYTALAAAGGVPTAFPRETANGEAQQIKIDPDHRVKALVLLAPAAAWFKAPDALEAVRVPILLWTAEKDSYTPEFHGEIIKQGLVDKTLLEHRIVANGGHFCFLCPFPKALRNPGLPPSEDPEGFDRELFHEEMNAGILEFLRRALGIA